MTLRCVWHTDLRVISFLRDVLKADSMGIVLKNRG